MRPVLDFVRCETHHVKQLALQHRQAAVKIEITDAIAAELCAQPVAEALLADGVPVAAGGLVDEQAGRAKAWAAIGADMPWTAWKLLIGRMRGHIDAALAPDGWAHRVWAETVYDWAEGHKLLLHLGLEYEGLTRGTFGPTRHACLYAKVRADVAPLPVRVRCMNMTAERCLWEDSLGDVVPWAVEEALRVRRAGGRQPLQRSEAAGARTVPLTGDA